MLSEPDPFLRDTLIQKPSGTTNKIHDHNDYPQYHIPHKEEGNTLLTLLHTITAVLVVTRWTTLKPF
jgi:hypothetical protein